MEKRGSKMQGRKYTHLKSHKNFAFINAPFLYPLKISENLMVSCFQGVEKECIENTCVKDTLNLYNEVQIKA